MQTTELDNYHNHRDRFIGKKHSPASQIANCKDSSVPTTAPQNGWDYWTRVYNDSNCRNSLSIRDTRISYLLASENLVRAKLLFLNVPGLPNGYKSIILNLLKRELKEEVPIQDVIARPGRWYLNFYRPEDALRVLKAFNGFVYRSHTLVVRFCYPDGTYGDEAALAELVSCTSQNSRQLQANTEVEQESDIGGVWSPVEEEAIRTFERELTTLLKMQTSIPYPTAMSMVRNVFINKKLSSYFIGDALGQWSTGFVRIFDRTIKVVANTVCLSSSNYYTQRIRDAAKEGSCGSIRDSWEPCIPFDIRNEARLKQYAHAFLCHFGPQHIFIDIPIRLFAHSLRGVFPKTSHELAKLLTSLSATFIVVNDVLYLSSFERHHSHIIDNLAAFQEDSEDEIGTSLEADFCSPNICDTIDEL